MSDTAIYSKTESGAEEIQARARGLPPRLRTMLIMVDGVRTAAQLDAAAATLGAPSDFLQSLQRMGLVRHCSADPGAPACGPVLVAASNGADNGGADSASGRPSSAERFRSAQKLMNDSAVDALGLRAFFVTLKLEKAATCDDLRQLMPVFRKAIAKGSGEDAAALLETRVLSILD